MLVLTPRPAVVAPKRAAEATREDVSEDAEEIVGMTGTFVAPPSARALGRVMIRRGERTVAFAARPVVGVAAPDRWDSVVVVDVSERVAGEPDTVVTPEDLARFERRHGRIPRDAVVAMYSGWETRAGSVEAYQNMDAGGSMRFPGFGNDAVEWLIERRRIRGIGVDTMSLDHGSSTTFDVHLTVLRAGCYGVENLRNLKQLPPRGATILLGLIPWDQGSGGPCRAFASV